MKALILAGGQATRLRPITHDLPKCLLPVGSTTIIDFQLDTLKANQVTDIVIVTGFKADILERHVRANHSDLTLTFVHNDLYATTRAAYGIWTARQAITDDIIIYLNGDLLCDPIIIKKVIGSEYDSVTAIQKTNWDEEEVNVILDTDQRVTNIGKLIAQADSHGEFLGATKLSPTLMTHVLANIQTMVDHNDLQHFAVDAINQAIHQQGDSLYALDVTDHLATEIDTIEDYQAAQAQWANYEGHS